MADSVYPENFTKEIEIPKEGYNSLSIVRENNDAFVVQLYNPNVKPPEPKKPADKTNKK